MTETVKGAFAICLLTICTVVAADDADPLQRLLTSMADRAYPEEGMDSQGVLRECPREVLRGQVSPNARITSHSLPFLGTCYEWREVINDDSRCIVMEKPVERILTRNEARIFLTATLLPPLIRRVDVESANPVIDVVENVVGPANSPIHRVEAAPCANTELASPHLPSSSGPQMLEPTHILANEVPANISFAPPMPTEDVIRTLKQRFASDLAGSYYWFVPGGESFVTLNGSYFRVASFALVVPSRDCSSPISENVDVWFGPNGTVAKVYFGLALCLA